MLMVRVGCFRFNLWPRFGNAFWPTAGPRRMHDSILPRFTQATQGDCPLCLHLTFAFLHGTVNVNWRQGDWKSTCTWIQILVGSPAWESQDSSHRLQAITLLIWRAPLPCGVDGTKSRWLHFGPRPRSFLESRFHATHVRLHVTSFGFGNQLSTMPRNLELTRCEKHVSNRQFADKRMACPRLLEAPRPHPWAVRIITRPIPELSQLRKNCHLGRVAKQLG